MPLIDLGRCFGFCFLHNQLNCILDLRNCSHRWCWDESLSIVRFGRECSRRLEDHDWVRGVLLPHLVLLVPSTENCVSRGSGSRGGGCYGDSIDAVSSEIEEEWKEGANAGELSDSRRARSSGGSSRSLKACWSWLAEKGISTSYWVDMLSNACYPTANCRLEQGASCIIVGSLIS
jgi:hypothetical protein